MNNIWLQNMPANSSQGYLMCIIDVDNLKGNNDELGHESGDRLIIRVAELLKTLSNNALVFRLGGDEFAMVVRCELSELAEKGRFINGSLYQVDTLIKSTWPTSGISYGLSSFVAMESLPESIREADANMYKLKSSKLRER